MYGVALDTVNQDLFWSTGLDDSIGRAELDGSNPTNLLTFGGSPHPGQLALDVPGGHMYWLNFGFPDSIQRSNLDGSGVTTILSVGARSNHGLALDLGAGHLYWTEQSAGTLMRANLDGSNVTQELSGLTAR